MKHLGEKLDLHCGGVDNMFPHHTNEIAQSESYLGHKWCNYWFHVHHLNDETGKMSKSKGEFLTVSLLEKKGYDPLVYRMFVLQSHYRKPLTFSWETLEQTAATYKKLRNRISAIENDGAVDENALKDWHEKFAQAVGNDCNTAMGLTLLYDVIKSELNGATKRSIIEDYDTVLSLDLLKPVEEEEVDDELKSFVEMKIAERAEAKKAKDFAKADAIRAELAGKGIVIKDTREGVVWSRE
jgi:cysteinyl-tRNA synthetase